MKKILFVCTGNTCRSPMAEAVAKNIIKERNITGITVSSAGILAEEGKPISGHAKEALKLIGINYTHKAKQLTEEMISQYGLILTMTGEQKKRIGKYDNILTVEEFTGRKEISDPYGQNLISYIETLQEIVKAVGIIFDKITLEINDVIFWLYKIEKN